METKTDYNKQATDFLKSTDSTITVEFLKNGKHFDSDTETRDIYKITLKRGNRSMTFNFGNSLNDSGFKISLYNRDKVFDIPDNKREYFLNPENFNALYYAINMQADFVIKRKEIIYPTVPSEYDILSCLQKHDVGDLEDFCGEFGYDIDSMSANKTYKAVLNEYTQLATLYNDSELKLMAEIQ